MSKSNVSEYRYKWVHKWADLESFLIECQGVSGMTGTRHSRHEISEWNGNVTFDDAVNLAKFGWKEGAKSLAKFQHSLAPNCGEKETYNWDTTGLYFDIGAVVSGVPECWLDTVLEPSQHCVSICASIGFNRGIEADAIMRRGAAICALIDALENSGVRIALSVYHGTHCNRHASCSMFIDLKHHDQPLDLDRVAFCLAHPAMQRRLTFAWKECQDANFRWRLGINTEDSYGYSIDRPECLPAEALFLSAGSCDFDSDDKARAWLAKTIAEFQQKDLVS